MKNMMLYELCNENNWFTHGSSTQYHRMFDLNDDGALKLSKCEYLLNALARVIWICSDPEITYDSIKEKLLEGEANDWYE